MSNQGWPITFGGRRYHFAPARYFAVAEDRPAEASMAPDDERLWEIVERLTGPSGADRET